MTHFVVCIRQTDSVADWSPLRALLTDIETSLTVSWGELDRPVDGLPQSAYVHNAFRKGDRSGGRDSPPHP